MKIKFSFSFLFAFLSLLFLLHELHDWSHYQVAKMICGCYGQKGFDNWSVCGSCEIAESIVAFSWLAGPIFTFSVVWLARYLMKRSFSMETRSVGFCLFFAANPFSFLLAALTGGGDINQAFKMMFPKFNETNHHLLTIITLLITLLLIVPPFLKAFKMVRSKTKKWKLYPAFIFGPIIIEKLVVGIGMNWLLKQGLLDENVLSGIPLLIIVWNILLITIFTISFMNLTDFLSKDKRKVSKRNRGDYEFSLYEDV